MSLQMSVFLPPTADTPDLIRLAEDLGFHRAWVYDSPLLYHDPFISLARAAERTTRIGLGIGVIVPRLRAPAATAAALATLTALAPGRVVAAIGAGFTGRFTLGLGAVPLADLAREVGDLRALLGGGETPHVEGGAPVRLIPVPGAAGSGTLPLVVSCRGPKAQRLARDIGDGAMTGIFYPGGLGLVRAAIGPELPLSVHAVGAVRDDGEALDSPRLVATVGPVVAVAFHAFAEQPWRLDGLPDDLRQEAERYIASVNSRLDPTRRHQDLHRGHLVRLELPEDRERVTPANVARFSLTGTVAELRERAEGLSRDGVTELCIQPGGDIPAEMRRLAGALVSS
jgi:5,10-methylenetetrahydromethanopterin reductase